MTDTITGTITDTVETADPDISVSTVELDTSQFISFLQGIPPERDLMTWVNWLARPVKKIAIIGFTNSKDDAPWGDPEWEIWICNDLHKIVSDKWHRLYDLHSLKEIRSNKEHDAFMRTTDKQVFVFDPQPEWPTATAFPKADINGLFGKYFTNSISWMIAHAMLEGATDIGVWGVDLATGTEYAAQRPSCEYFLGFAAGRGINIYVPPASDLLKIAYQYGAEDDSPVRAKWDSREKELSDRLGQMQAQHSAMGAQMNQLMGALEQVRYDKGVWLSPSANRDGTPKSMTPSDNRGAGNGQASA